MLCIQTQALTKRFGRVHALDGLDFSVPQGAIQALVGPNGAGKTTLIKILMNIFRASTGTASVLGIDSRRISGRAFSSIGYVSENQHLPPWMRVGAFLEYLRPFYPTWDTQLEAQLVQKFDLPLDRKLKHLSRGRGAGIWEAGWQGEKGFRRRRKRVRIRGRIMGWQLERKLGAMKTQRMAELRDCLS